MAEEPNVPDIREQERLLNEYAAQGELVPPPPINIADEIALPPLPEPAQAESQSEVILPNGLQVTGLQDLSGIGETEIDVLRLIYQAIEDLPRRIRDELAG